VNWELGEDSVGKRTIRAHGKTTHLEICACPSGRNSSQPQPQLTTAPEVLIIRFY
jgi:hypothetical protein